MTSPRPRRFNRRWAAPVLTIMLVAGGSLVPNLIGSASASPPDLPPLTPAELLAKARTAQVTALSGTIQLTSNLGLPSLDSLRVLGGGGSNTSIASLLAGEHSAQIWIDGVDHVRVATMAPLAETNWVRNGTDLWSYDSATLTTTHATLPATNGGDATDAAETADAAGDDAAESSDAADPSSAAETEDATDDDATESGDATDATDATGGSDGTGVSIPDPAKDTPIEFAQELLDNVTPSTDVTVDTNARIDGRPVYQLVLTPHEPTSTVEDVTIAIDAPTGLPLDVRITAKEGGTALALGFTDISFDVPSAATFEFSPPPDSTVVEAADPSELLSAGGERHGPHHHRVPDSTAAGTDGSESTDATDATDEGQTQNGSGVLGASGLGDVTVLGHDWSSVAMISGSSMSSQFDAILGSATRVQVGATSARLITTRLFSVLIFDDGRVAIGAISGDALAAIVAAG